MKGYHLAIGKDGPKLRESGGAALASATEQHRSGQAESHNHSGPVVFGGSATYRAANQTMADLARILSDQTGLPIDDETGLTGKYDISLRRSGTGTAQAGNHGDGAWSGGGTRGARWGGGDASGRAADPSGSTLFNALQQQLGLRLAPAEQTLARLFVVDRALQHPTEN